MSRSASLTSSSVALNDSINVWGSFRKNPTVSVSRTRCLFGKTKLRVVGSSVAKSLFSVTTSAPVSRFSQFDLQAAFAAARALRKNVEDQLGSIENFAREQILQVSTLRR